MPFQSDRELILLGTGTSHGVPVIGCHCEVCESDDPKNKRTRTGVAVRTQEGTFLIDTSPELRLQLIREKIDLVEAVIYTHGHADHLFGLDDLRLFGYQPLFCTMGPFRCWSFVESGSNHSKFWDRRSSRSV